MDYITIDRLVYRVFKLVPPTPHLKPEKVEEKKMEEASPFVYTPFSVSRDRGTKDVTKTGE